MKFINLSDCPEYTYDIAKTCFDYWKPECIALNIMNVEDYIASMGYTIVAVDNGWVGTVSVDAEDLSTHKYLSPWLSSLFVKENYRGKGIAKLLVSCICSAHDIIYLWTYSNLVPFYKKFGFYNIYILEDKYIMKFVNVE